eukprot:COSAG01_NODE_17_length_39991_cov_30.596160_50_plen_74_part_00
MLFIVWLFIIPKAHSACVPTSRAQVLAPLGIDQVVHAAPNVSTPLFHDKNTQHAGKSQSKRPHTMWKHPLTSA